MSLNSLSIKIVVIELSRTIRRNLFKSQIAICTITIPSNTRCYRGIVIRSKIGWNNPNLNRINLKLVKAFLQRQKQRCMIKNITGLIRINRILATLGGNITNISISRLHHKTCYVALLHRTCILPIKTSPSPSETERHGVRSAVTTAAVVTCHLKWKRTHSGWVLGPGRR